MPKCGVATTWKSLVETADTQSFRLTDKRQPSYMRILVKKSQRQRFLWCLLIGTLFMILDFLGKRDWRTHIPKPAQSSCLRPVYFLSISSQAICRRCIHTAVVKGLAPGQVCLSFNGRYLNQALNQLPARRLSVGVRRPSKTLFSPGKNSH